MIAGVRGLILSVLFIERGGGGRDPIKPDQVDLQQQNWCITKSYALMFGKKVSDLSKTKTNKQLTSNQTIIGVKSGHFLIV